MRKSTDMCTKMPNNVLEERLRWFMPIIQKDLKLKDAARVFPGGQRTSERKLDFEWYYIENMILDWKYAFCKFKLF